MSNFTDQELQQAYLKLLRDPELDKLELALNEPNIFSILSIEHMEIRHSNFLGWLLNPKENHGLNDMFLKRFLREIFIDGKIKEVQPLDAENLNYQKVEIKREWQNIDLLIKFPDLIICIENKVWSKDHSEQLKRYKAIIDSEFPDPALRKVFVYLTPHGNASSNEQDTYAFISYRHVIDILERILTVYNQLISQQAYFYIQDYIKSTKRNLMGNDSTNEAARDIYRNHKKLIDFIYANRPNALNEFAQVAKEVLLTEGYVLGSEQSNVVRFLPSSISTLIPNYGKSKGWLNGEGLLFEFLFGDRDTYLRLTASPNSDESFRNRLKELVEPELIGKNYNWQGWLIFHEQKLKLEYKDAKLDRQSVEREIKGLLLKLKPAIDLVERTMLNHSAEFISIKQKIESITLTNIHNE